MNKAYRTLLAGVLSILFVGPALGREAPGETQAGARPDARRANPSTPATPPRRYTGNETIEGMPR